MTTSELTNDCLSGVIRLTEQRDQDSLDLALIDLLREMPPGFRAGIYIFTLGEYPFSGSASLQPGDIRLQNILEPGASLAMSSDPALQPCLDQGVSARLMPAANMAGGFYALPGGHGLRGVLWVEPADAERLDSGVLDNILRIYLNLTLFINKNERDALTGLLNRKAFDERLESLMQRSRRHADSDEQACFAFLDIDHFKQVNDRYGHLYGDEVLLWFARIMEETFRHTDMLFRYGGEEFCVILNKADLAKSIKVLERFRAAVEGMDFPIVGRVTVSIGVVNIDHADPLSTIIDKADKALYYAKNHGRNQVNSYEQLVVDGLLHEEAREESGIELF